jgi:pimeloyl-ACP methyl ester carboxylesterase
MVTATARRAVLPFLLALAVLGVGASSARAALAWKSCVDFRGVKCATLDQPLDRSGAVPGTVPLRIARVGKTTGPTLMYLSGGPGGAGVSEMLSVISMIPRLEDRFRVIGYDQRGTGRSGLLRCPRLEKDVHLRDTAAAEECANRIGVARHFYTTPDSVLDMEAIRAQLGVDKLTLFGISYGTELAIAYARAFPQHVERLILDSTVDADDRDPYAQASFHNMAPSLRDVCPGHCREISADPGGDLAKLVAQTRGKSLQAFAYDSLGRSHRVKIGPVALLDLMFTSDYVPAIRATIPAAVKAALNGDGALLARLIREVSRYDDLGSPRDFSTARYATVCETTPLPWDPGTPLDQRAAVTAQRIALVPPTAFLPFDASVVVDDEIDFCLRWPDVPRVPSPAPPPPYPSVPTLILQGAEDLRTPPEWSANVAARIPGAKRYVVPGIGHSTVSDPRTCSADLILRFVRNAKLPSKCKRVPTGVPAYNSPPESFSSLEGIPGYSRKVGRTLRAVSATAQDLLLMLSIATASSGGGLRGGSWAVSGRKLVMRDYQAVTGVSVDGTLTANTLTLTVGGTQGAKGSVRVHRGKLTGTLGGKKISTSLGPVEGNAARVQVRFPKRFPALPR